MSIIQQSCHKDFTFRSRFSREIREIFINCGMTMKDVAEKLGLSPADVSAYYNDRYLLKDDDALALSNLLKEIGHYYPPKHLKLLQKQAIFVDLTKNDLLDEVRENVE